MENLIDEKVSDVLKVDVSDGDVLLVTLPEGTKHLPNGKLTEYSNEVVRAFDQILSDKEVKTVVVPYGMKVEVIKADTFNDKE